MNTPGTQIDYTEVTKEVPRIDPFNVSLELLCFPLQCTSLHSSPVIQPLLVDTGLKGLEKHTTAVVGSLQCSHPHHLWDYFPQSEYSRTE
jgi:hypothetical protein